MPDGKQLTLCAPSCHQTNLGIGVLPDYLIRLPRLVQVLPETESG